MGQETVVDIEFDSKSEAVDALSERIEDGEMCEELLEAINEAAVVLIEEFRLGSEIDCESLAGDLTIGFAEWICRFIDSNVKTSESVPRLIDDIRNDPINNTGIVLGRMTDRSRPCRLVSRAMWTQRRST
ncbi:hypothetical protein [Halosimplex halobium]|uniref:hypothetical protein n=1 Tax=Halosimplex halobium TaxID=3396618 RepID=UPI003F56719E